MVNRADHMDAGIILEWDEPDELRAWQRRQVLKEILLMLRAVLVGRCWLWASASP